MVDPTEAAFEALLAAIERHPDRWSEVAWCAALAALDRLEPGAVETFLDGVDDGLQRLKEG